MLDDLKKLAATTELFSLDRMIGRRLMRLFYLAGLAAIVLWAMDHLFFTFSFGFGNGLWGLLEIAVIAPLALLALRIACEAGILVFKNNKQTIDLINRQAGLKDEPGLTREINEAIDELANEVSASSTAPEQDKPASKGSSTKKTVSRSRKAPPLPAKASPLPAKTPGRSAKRKPPSRAKR